MTITLLLTIIAFKFVIASYVPPTPYLTLLDRYVLLAFVLICVVIFEHFTVSFYDLSSSSHWLVAKGDIYFACVVTAVWTCFHLGIILGTARGSFYMTWDQVENGDDSTDCEMTLSSDDVKVEKNDEDDDDEPAILQAMPGTENRTRSSTDKSSSPSLVLHKDGTFKVERPQGE